MSRFYLLSAATIAVLVAAAMFWSGATRHYPQLKVTLPGQGELVFIDTPWADNQKCLDANRRVREAIARTCSQCRFVESCEGQTDPEWLSALAGQPIRGYVVHSGSLRIVVNAGTDSKQICIVTAEQIALDKKKTARCVFPL